MGLIGSPDIFQAIINDLMGDLQNVRAYLDDILVTTAGSYEDHLKHVELVLQRLTDAGFAVNLRKSSFAGRSGPSTFQPYFCDTCNVRASQ